MVLALWLALFLRQTLDEPLHTVNTSLHGRQIDVRHIGPLVPQQARNGEAGIQETVLNLYRDFRSHEGGNEKILLYHPLENCYVFLIFSAQFLRYASESSNIP